MAKTATQEILLPDEVVMNQIYVIRGQKVMLDRYLAELYGVETKVLKQAVRRNIERFPPDFMFEMTPQEFSDWRSQFVTSNTDRQGLRYAPFCFLEAGVAQLSSVLNSKRAIMANIQIIRVFTRMRQLLTDNIDIRLQIEQVKNAITELHKKQSSQDKNIELVFHYLDELDEKIKRPPLLPDREMVGYKIGKGKK